MRSQTTKPLPKKGALGKTNSPNKQNKKRVTSNKKLKLLVSKNVIKSPRKKVDTSNKNDGESSSDSDKPETSAESSKTSLSKSNSARSESPTKKPKKDNKEKKDTIKATAKKVAPKKPVKLTKKQKLVQKSNAKKTEDNDDVKYKINLEMVKNAKSKFSKAKLLVKKGKVSKKKSLSNKQECSQSEVEKGDDGENKHVEDQLLDQTKDCESKVENNDKQEKPENNLDLQNETVHSNSTVVHQQSPKTEVERPPKFFTSSRSPRTVDIDIKCSKNSKGNLSVSERFISTKCETISEDSSKEKNISNTLVSQGPDFDVYTFSEKVDSPKSILSDFRNPVNKNVGRVRPIARVKGTIIDKKTESEKKKYSPHRPIEEVVKQLKASKTSEDINTSQSTTSPSGLDFCFSDIPKESEDKPKPIVSKSYKMVARKSSVTGIPFSAIKFEEKDLSTKNEKTSNKVKKPSPTSKSNKKQQKSEDDSDDEFSTSKFSFNSKTFHYSSSDESVSESNDDNESKECSETETKNKKSKNKRYKRITDSAKKNTSKELKELSKDSLIDLKDESTSCNEKASKRHLKLLSMWNGPKRHRMASLNAIAKVHCLYENESRTHMELGLMKTVDRHIIPSTSKSIALKKKEAKTREAEKDSSNSESDYDGKSEKKNSSSESSDEHPPQRSLRGEPGIRSAGKYWDPKSSTSSSEESEMETKRKVTPEKKKTLNKTSSMKSDSDKPSAKMKKTAGVPVKKKRNRAEIVMDLKDMVVQKRMASLNATAILAASYEKRSPKSSKDDTTSDSCSDESFSHKPKNGVSSGVKSEVKNEETKKECDEGAVADRKQKVEVIVNDTDVTITGVYATHHEGFCTVSGMQYRISATSHTQTTATANCEKEGCSRDDGARYTPLTALSSMQPPAEHPPPHTHGAVPELGGLARRAAGCSSAFSPPSPSAHHEPGYYQPAGPLIKESGADAERALARYHPPPHYHAHPPVLPQYNSYYPPDLCYGRYYRPPGPYHMTPPQPDGQMVGVGGEPYPPPQYYGTPPCYQHSPQRIPYVGCSCPSMNAYPKNVHIGPATGKAPTGGGPADVPSALAAPGAAFRPKVRACALDAVADTHGSGKDPPLGPEPSAAADAPDPCSIPAIGSASPKREFLDVRDNLRLLEVPGRESIGPPSPARGSAGVCAPQPPPVQRRARLGKAMARRTLVGDNTDLLLSTPRRQQEPDDDVLAISPPLNVPIDLSSSDERSTPLVDVKKENEGPTNASTRKTDALALREQNTTTSPIESDNLSNAAKTVKRRYSRTKLEIDMKDTQLEDTCKTNGIGEHVKLQKRRKVSGDQTEMRLEPVTKEPRKRTTSKKQPKTPTTEKRIVKRKIDSSEKGPNAKRMLCETLTDSNPRLINVAAVPDVLSKPKTKSALLLDNLIRKNSIDGKGYVSGKEINPADLFLTPLDNSAQNKRTLNNNNNIVDNKVTSNGVRQNTIAAVSQHIEKKLASKNACKLEKIDSKITFNSKSVLKPQTENNKKEEIKTSMCELKDERSGSLVLGKGDTKCVDSTNVSCLPLRQDNCNENIISKEFKNNLNDISLKASKLKSNSIKLEDNIEKLSNESQPAIIKSITNFDFDAKDKCEIKAIKKSNTVKVPTKRCNRIDSNGELKSKNVERVIKLLASKKPGKETESSIVEEKCTKDVSDSIESDLSSIPKRPQFTTKNGESKFANIDKVVKLLAKKPTSDIVALVGDEVENEKLCNMPKLTKDDERINEDVNKVPIKRSKVEKVAKLLVSKKLAIKTDEASLVVEDACASPVPHARRRRRRSGAGVRRPRRVPAPLALPALEHRNPPRWSNGWNWDGENYISKVYLNNDSRLDRSARCWPRMVHASGDRVARGDCVLLRASVAKAQPFVARVASLWENPEDGEMMVSLVWYYRPEHTDLGRQPGDAHDEVFASRHRDANSVACIEDKCYVLTFNEYCRYRKRLKAAEEGITVAPSIVPPLPASEVTPLVAPNDSKLPPSVSPELVLFCRKVYDFRSKKIQVPNK